MSEEKWEIEKSTNFYFTKDDLQEIIRCLEQCESESGSENFTLIKKIKCLLEEMSED